MEEDEQKEEEGEEEEVEDEEHKEEGPVWRRRTRAEMLQETGELRPKLVKNQCDQKTEFV